MCVCVNSPAPVGGSGLWFGEASCRPAVSSLARASRFSSAWREAATFLDDEEDEQTRGSEDRTEPNVDTSGVTNKILPIFTTHLWKRSCLALLIFLHATLQLCILQLSFSKIFGDNVLKFLVGLFAMRLVVRQAATDYMCEVLLIIPIHIVSQVTLLVSLLAAPHLFDFLASIGSRFGASSSSS